MSHSWPFPPSPWLFSWSSGVLVSPYVNLSVFRSWAERTKRSRGRACFCLWASLCGIMTTSPPLFSHFDHLSWSCPVISRQKSSTNYPGQIWCLSQNYEGAVKIIEAFPGAVFSLSTLFGPIITKAVARKATRRIYQGRAKAFLLNLPPFSPFNNRCLELFVHA